VLSARLTWPTALFADVVASQSVAKVPELKSLPTPNQNVQAKPKPLSLLNEPEPSVSPETVIVFFSQVLEALIVYELQIVLPPSKFLNSAI